MSDEKKFILLMFASLFLSLFGCSLISYGLSLVISVNPGHIMIIIFCAVVIYKMWYKDGY